MLSPFEQFLGEWLERHPYEPGAIVLAFGAVLLAWSYRDNLWSLMTSPPPRPGMFRSMLMAVQPGQSWWTVVHANGATAVRVVIRATVTNLTDRELWLPRAEFALVRGQVQPLIRHPDIGLFGRFPIPPRATTDIEVAALLPGPLPQRSNPLRLRCRVFNNLGEVYALGGVEPSFVR